MTEVPLTQPPGPHVEPSLDPTAKQIVAVAHATPDSSLLTTEELVLTGSGLGTTTQLVPFQRSINVCVPLVRPTAKQFVALVHATDWS